MDDMFGMLFSGLEPRKKLLTAVSCNMIDTLNSLLDENKVQIDERLLVQNNNRALHICAQKGFSGCMRVLLQRGADPDVVNSFGFSPLAMALKYGHCACVTLLLESGSHLSDPSFIWQSQQMNELPTWVGFSPDVLQLLLVATPDLRIQGEQVSRVMFNTFLRTVQSADLIRLYLLSGNSLTNEEWHLLESGVTYLPNEALLSWLANWRKQPPSLQHNARLSIRRAIVPNVVHGHSRLPVPITLQEYLLFPEVPRLRYAESYKEVT